MESRTVFCGTLLTRRSAEEEARGGWGGEEEIGEKALRGGNLQELDVLALALAAQKGRRGRRRAVAASRRHSDVGGDGDGRPAAEHGRRAIRNPDRGAYDLLVGRGKAPVLCGACQSGGGGLPCREGGRLCTGQAGGGGHRWSGAVNLIN